MKKAQKTVVQLKYGDTRIYNEENILKFEYVLCFHSVTSVRCNDGCV